MHDLLIRGATVVDGLGHDPIRADVRSAVAAPPRSAGSARLICCCSRSRRRTRTQAGEMRVACWAIWLYPEDRRANHEPERIRSRFAT